MPIQHTVTLYYYHELSDKAKVFASNWFIETNDTWYYPMLEDAEQCGVDIRSWDIYGNTISGEFNTSAPEVAEYVLANFGETCRAHPIAKKYYGDLQSIGLSHDEAGLSYEEWDEKKTALDNNFLNLILDSYLSLLKEEYDYSHSEAYISECCGEEYTFLENGKRFG